MKFFELESFMSSHGVFSLAGIARALSTTPQAVSNWKSRNQVPHHIVAKLSNFSQVDGPLTDDSQSLIHASSLPTSYQAPISVLEKDTINLSDVILLMAEQLKVIVLTTFISIFITFTYVQFIKVPQYISWATVLLPESKMGNLGGLAGVASQFGVSVPTESTADLSSPSLYPDLLSSRIFAEKILYKEFYVEKYGKKLPLLSILTHGDDPPGVDRDILVASAISSLSGILEFNEASNSPISSIKVTTFDPLFAKQLAEVVLSELEALNRFYKSQTTNKKTVFIEQRIAAVEGDLESLEQALKVFNQQNRQISSPALQLDHERLERDVEIQKEIYLTLKQQLELAKIEAVQQASMLQILDKPQVALGPSNKNLKLNVVLAGIFGVSLGILLAFVRGSAKNADIDERKKFRRIKHFIKKKTKDIILDRRVSGIVSVLLLVGSPYYLGYESKNPIFFGMYSARLMLLNTIYLITLLSTFILFIYSFKKKNDIIK